MKKISVFGHSKPIEDCKSKIEKESFKKFWLEAMTKPNELEKSQFTILFYWLLFVMKPEMYVCFT